MKNIFKQAHKMTREIVEKYDVDYRVQFGLCLQFLFEESKEITNEEDLKERLVNVMEKESEIKLEEITHYSCNKWIKYDKKRVYVELYFRYRGGLRGSFKIYIDYTDEDEIYTSNMSGTGSHVYNDMIKSGYQLVRDNIDEVINVAA